MGIQEEGFLSDDIEEVRAGYRAKFPEIITLATGFSRLGQEMLLSIGNKPRTLKNYIVATYFIRGLQQCQAAIVLAERGLFTEAYTIVRSALETLFYLGAATRATDFGRELGRDQVKRTKVGAEAYLRQMKELDPLADEAEVKAVIEKNMALGIDPVPLMMEAVAKKAELSLLYDMLYRPLSNGHAHPTLASLSSILELDENQEPHRINWGPDRGKPDEFSDVLQMNCTVLHQLLAEWLRFSPDETLNERFEKIVDRFRAFSATLSARSAR